MSKWEYTYILGWDEWKKLGKEGWELVQVFVSSSPMRTLPAEQIGYFKRPIIAIAEKASEERPSPPKSVADEILEELKRYNPIPLNLALAEAVDKINCQSSSRNDLILTEYDADNTLEHILAILKGEKTRGIPK